MDFPLTLTEALLAIVIVFAGSIIQGSVGFGLGPLAVPLLVLLDPVFVPGPLLLAALLLTFLLYRREKHAVVRSDLTWAVFGRLLGTVVGAVLLESLSGGRFSLWAGILVLAALGIFASGMSLPVNRLNLVSAGTVSGFMGTVASIGGAPMALLFQDQKGPRIRGTLSGIFVVGTVLSIASLIVIGRFGVRELLAAAVLVPGIAAGYWISARTAPFLDAGRIRMAVLTVAGLAAGLLIVRNFVLLV